MRTRVFLCCLALASAMSACAPTWQGPTASSSYLFDLDVSSSATWLGVSDTVTAMHYPPTATVLVHVRDQQGRPVDGVPVDFALEPSWTHRATLTPAQAVTQGGVAQALFAAPQTTGLVQISARVENVTARTTLTVESYTEWHKD